MAKIDKKVNKKSKESPPIKVEEESKKESRKINKKASDSLNQSNKGWWSTKWESKKFRYGVIGGSIVVVALALGLGLGLGLKDRRNYGCIFLPEESICDYDLEYTTTIKDSRKAEYSAIVWLFEDDEGKEYLESIGIPNVDTLLENAETRANLRIQTEKDGYKSNHGGSWKSQWDRDLEAKGFDDESEYKESIISATLTSNISNSLKWDVVYMSAADIDNINGDKSAWKYAAVENTTNGVNRYRILNEKIWTSFDKYIQEEKPISASHVLLGNSWGSNDDGGDGGDGETFSTNLTGKSLTQDANSIEKTIRFVADAHDSLTNNNSWNFAELAEEFSTDSSASSGGNLGVVSAKSTGWVNEFNFAVYAMLSDSSIIPTSIFSGNGTTTELIVRLENLFDAMNDGLSSGPQTNGIWSNADIWTGTSPDITDKSGIDNFFDTEDINHFLTTEQVPINIGTYDHYNNLSTSTPSWNIITDRLTLDSYDVATENYWIADPEQWDYSGGDDGKGGPTNSTLDASYTLTWSQYGLHILRVDQLYSSETLTGTIDDTNSGPEIADLNLINELGYRMLRHQLTLETSSTVGLTSPYNLTTNYNSYVESNVSKWSWEKVMTENNGSWKARFAKDKEYSIDDINKWDDDKKTREFLKDFETQTSIFNPISTFYEDEKLEGDHVMIGSNYIDEIKTWIKDEWIKNQLEINPQLSNYWKKGDDN